MGLKLPQRISDSIEFIHRRDEAIGPLADYSKYRDTMDKQYLDLQGEATVFKVVPVTPGRRSRAIDAAGGLSAVRDQLLKFGAMPMEYSRGIFKWALVGLDYPAGDNWPERLIVRERGYICASDELLDVLEDDIISEVALVAIQAEGKALLLKKK